MALEALSQQQAARLGQWGEMSGTFLQDNMAFPLPQQLAHLGQPGMVRFPHQLLRANSWGLSAGMEDDAIVSASAGPPFTRWGLGSTRLSVRMTGRFHVVEMNI